MAFEDIVQDKLWAIRHKPTGKLLRQWPCGYGHTQLDVEDSTGVVAKGTTPRLFLSEDAAKRALIKWLQGVHRNHWEDGLEISTPKVPRVKEDMEVIPVYLYTDAKNEYDY